MKITGYTQQVTNVSGSGSAPTLNASVQAKAAASDVVDMSPVAKGLGDWAKTIDAIHEQEDKQNILAAMDSYNKDMDNLLNNETDGLLRTKEAGAQGITEAYVAKSKELQSGVTGNTKLHFRANKLALENFFSKASQQGFEQVRNHQMQQNEKLQLTHLGNIQADMNLNASKHYDNTASLDAYKNQLGIAVEMVYSKYGPERVEAEKRKAYGEYANTALQSAVANNDYSSQQQIFEKYGDYLTASQRINFEKLSYKKQADQWQRNTINSVMAGGGSLADMLNRLDGISERTVTEFGGSDLVTQFRNKIGKEAYYLDGVEGSNNTGCAKAITSLPGLKGTDYQGVTWVPTLMEIAKKNKEWHEGTAGIQPGDLIITNGDGHVSMFTGSGEIQNGKSGHNNVGSAGGKGGVWEHEGGLPTNVTGYISMRKYSSNTGGQRTEALTLEQKDDLKRALITKYNQEQFLKNAKANSIKEEYKQKAYDLQTANPAMTSAEAMTTLIDRAKFPNVDDYEAAKAGIVRIFGGGGKNSTGVKGPGAGKGDAEAVYYITKQLEAGAFGTDAVKFSQYIHSDDCAMLSVSNRAKLEELFDDYVNKKGAYKYNWSDIDAQMLGDNKLSAGEKERQLSVGRAAALDLLKNWKPEKNGGQLRPTDGQMIEAARKGILEKRTASMEVPGRVWGTNTKTLDIPLGALLKEGYTDMTQMADGRVMLWRDRNRGLGDLKPVEQVADMFPLYVK